MDDKDKVQGEGDYEAARRYRNSSEAFAEKGDVKRAAEKARKAVEGQEGDALREAEKEGRSKAREEDPKLKR